MITQQQLTDKCKELEQRCKLHEDAGVLLSKRIPELEQQNKQMLEVLNEIHQLTLKNVQSDFLLHAINKKLKYFFKESVTGKKIEEEL